MGVRVSVLLAAVVSLLAAGAVCASVSVAFDLNEANMVIAPLGPGSTNLRVTQSTISDLLVKEQEEGTLAILDRAYILDGGVDFVLDLALTQVSPEHWTATGTLQFADVDTSSYAAEASFQSMTVAMINDDLKIQGALSGSPILVNRGHPWVFQGVAAETPATYNADGVLGTITLDPTGHTAGTAVDVTIGMGLITDSLDELFASQRSFEEVGEIKGLITPEPATIMLLLAGMIGLAGRRRKGGR